MKLGARGNCEGRCETVGVEKCGEGQGDGSQY